MSMILQAQVKVLDFNCFIFDLVIFKPIDDDDHAFDDHGMRYRCFMLDIS